MFGQFLVLMKSNLCVLAKPAVCLRREFFFGKMKERKSIMGAVDFLPVGATVLNLVDRYLAERCWSGRYRVPEHLEASMVIARGVEKPTLPHP